MTLSLITHSNYDNILSTYLNILDSDPAYDNVEQLLSDIITAKNSAQWLIGDLLVFLRFRTDYQTIKTFPWSGSFSKEMIEFINTEYKIDFNEENFETQDFLYWTAYKHKRFWLLLDEQEIRVWDHHPSNVSDDEFDQYLTDLTIRLKAALGDQSLRAYYRTSRIYPFSARTPHSWSYHYEKTNYIAAKLNPKGSSGEERLQLIFDHLEETTDEFEKNGINRVAEVRDQIKNHIQNERGWLLHVPLPKLLIVTNVETGETLEGLRFTGENPNAIKAILSSAGIYTYHKNCELVWRERESAVYDSQKRLIATCPHIEENVVAEAISYLAEKMAWEMDMQS